jgi:hypothetical protein
LFLGKTDKRLTGRQGQYPSNLCRRTAINGNAWLRGLGSVEADRVVTTTSVTRQSNSVRMGGEVLFHRRLLEAALHRLDVGLSVICVQKVPLRKAREINALRHGVALNQLK